MEHGPYGLMEETCLDITHTHTHKHTHAPARKHTYMSDRASSRPRCEKVNYCRFGALRPRVVQVPSISNMLGVCKSLPIE